MSGWLFAYSSAGAATTGVGGDGNAPGGGWIYRHMGYLSQVGGGVAVMDMPGGNVWTGVSTMLLWYGAYFSEQVSWRNRWLVLWDWGRYRIFGRDNSRI